MYLAGKLSSFEVIDWKDRQPKHLRWWDMFLEDVELDLLEGISKTHVYSFAGFVKTCPTFQQSATKSWTSTPLQIKSRLRILRR